MGLTSGVCSRSVAENGLHLRGKGWSLHSKHCQESGYIVLLWRVEDGPSPSCLRIAPLRNSLVLFCACLCLQIANELQASSNTCTLRQTVFHAIINHSIRSNIQQRMERAHVSQVDSKENFLQASRNFGFPKMSTDFCAPLALTTSFHILRSFHFTARSTIAILVA